MPGLVTFPSLAVAVLNGFEEYDRTVTGYLVRKRIDNRFALAVVDETLKKA
jgi:hypothetical protein